MYNLEDFNKVEPSMTTATLDTHKLRMWCLIVLKNIEQERAEYRVLEATRRENRISEEVVRINGRWFNRLFHRKGTREIVEKRTEHTASNEYYIGEKAERVAKRLLAVCCVSERVNVSAEDIEQIRGWDKNDAAAEIFQQTLR